MTDNELTVLFDRIRKRLLDFRNSKDFDSGGSLSHFISNVIQIALSLSEIGLLRGRSISPAEEYWFEASYHLNFEFAGGNFQDLYDASLTLVEEVEKRNFFWS